MIRRIAVVTGTRAEYGLLYWIIRGIHEDPHLALQLIVTGMHLAAEFGFTVKEIEKDRIPIAERVEMLLASDTETAISASMGLGMIGFAKAYERLKPDMLLVLGDRFEILSAVAAAVPFRIPIAHIHGGEATEGLIDEQIRHAITKMSHIHFTAAEIYRSRVIQMGENPANVFCFGAPGLDNVYKLKLLNRKKLRDELGCSTDRNIGVVTFHPVTLEKDTAESQMGELLKALENFRDVYWIFTLPNADTGGRIIIKKIEDFTGRNPDAGKAFTSLGQLRYLSLLKCSSLMVGNSSSGLTEAASFELPVVNIGDRQRGRVRSKNVIDVSECKYQAINTAISKALTPMFKNSFRGMKNPYGEGSASKKIVDKIKRIKLGEELIKKRFYEIGSS